MTDRIEDLVDKELLIKVEERKQEAAEMRIYFRARDMVNKFGRKTAFSESEVKSLFDDSGLQITTRDRGTCVFYGGYPVFQGIQNDTGDQVNINRYVPGPWIKEFELLERRIEEKWLAKEAERVGIPEKVSAYETELRRNFGL